MRTDYFRYELIPRAPLGSVASAQARQGSLLRVCFEEEGSVFGYADCFPWPELGDQPLEAQLKLWSQGHLTPLTRRSFELARIDAEARKNGTDLFGKLQIPRCHAWVSDFSELDFEGLKARSDQGFTCLKIKLGREPLTEAKRLLELDESLQFLGLTLRLDFNSSLSADTFCRFMEILGSARERIDFIEDPMVYHPQVWREAQAGWRVRLALDRFPAGGIERGSGGASSDVLQAFGAFSVLIHKPAIQDPVWAVRLAQELGVSLVVTSYLDHPVGQLAAAWVASRIAQSHPRLLESCGFMSHGAYQSHSFSEQLRTKGPSLIPPAGTGFGMDELLSKLSWSPLSRGLPSWEEGES